METKVCKSCGRQLPIDEFILNNRSKDGHRHSCRECEKKNILKKQAFNPEEIYTNPELAKFSPKQLSDELKARGYHGELRFTQVKIIKL